MPLWLVLACAVLAACGKKGPPLAPIVRIPAAVEEIAAQRIGSDVYVTLTVPQENVDTSTPADVSRIEVYGYTGSAAPPRPRWAELGMLVASVPVVPAPRPGEPAGPPPDPAAGAVQGERVTIVDTLTGNELVQGPVAPPPAARPAATDAATAPVASGVPPSPGYGGPAEALRAKAGSRTDTPLVPPPLRRFYLAIPFGPGAPGPPGDAAVVTLADLPAPPARVDATYDAAAIAVAWTPSGGLLGYLLGREYRMEPPPFYDEAGAALAEPAPPRGPTRYNVYREVAPDPLALPDAAPAPAWRATPPTPVTPAPVASLAIAEPVAFERERCYTVRAIRGGVEGKPSPRACVRPVDVFPPAPPAAPEAVAAEGAISLIWEPVAAPDLGGYLVLRGEAGDATLHPLTPAPIFEPGYRDTTVTPGTRYAYAIVALDDRLPLGNRSAPSERVEETAR